MADRDAKRKRPITCLETGVTFESAYRAAKELGFADSRNIFRSIQRGTCTQGLHFYYADAPKPSPGFFLPPNRPPRPVVCLDTGETFESAFQAGRAFGIAAGAVRTSASTGVERNGLHFYYGDEPKPGSEFFRERHSKTRPIVCLETGETFDGNPAAARPLHVSPAAISQAVRDGSPVAGLHFYHGDEPKPAPEFFIPPNRAPRPVVCLDTGETFESSFQAGRAFGITPGGVRTSASTGVERGGLHFYYGDEPKPAPEFFRERHSKTRPIVCLETGETFVGNPAAARPLHVSPTAISQAVRYGSPVNGLHFYHGDEPKPAPEFFKPAKVKGGKSPAAIAAAAKVAAGNSAPGTDYREHGIQRNRRAVQ